MLIGCSLWLCDVVFFSCSVLLEVARGWCSLCGACCSLLRLLLLSVRVVVCCWSLMAVVCLRCCEMVGCWCQLLLIVVDR